MHGREDAIALISAATATETSAGELAGYSRACAFIVRSTGGTVSGTVTLEGCETNSSTDANWWTLDTVAQTTAGTDEVLVEFPPTYVRARLGTYANGTFTVSVQKIGNSGAV